jgi:hypothetical protein
MIPETGYRIVNSPMHPQRHPQQQQQHQQSTPHSRNVSPRRKGPTTSTPNKETPSARRCLPLNSESAAIGPTLRHHMEDSQVAYGSAYCERQRKVPTATTFYQGVEGAFIARTAVVSFSLKLLLILKLCLFSLSEV